MILKLLESRRARRIATGALVASVATHVLAAGAAARRPRVHTGDEPQPISVRYLLPPPQLPAEAVENINWAAIGPGSDGWQTGESAASAALPTRGGNQVALATHVKQEVPTPPGPEFDQALTYQEFEVDSAAAHDPASGGPTYPDELREKGVQGAVLVEFAVDTTGHVDAGTFVVVEASHPQFADAVREALPRMLFTPAVARGHRVRQLVRLPMKFKLITETAQGTS